MVLQVELVVSSAEDGQHGDFTSCFYYFCNLVFYLVFGRCKL